MFTKIFEIIKRKNKKTIKITEAKIRSSVFTELRQVFKILAINIKYKLKSHKKPTFYQYNNTARPNTSPHYLSLRLKSTLVKKKI